MFRIINLLAINQQILNEFPKFWLNYKIKMQLERIYDWTSSKLPLTVSVFENVVNLKSNHENPVHLDT